MRLNTFLHSSANDLPNLILKHLKKIKVESTQASILLLKLISRSSTINGNRYTSTPLSTHERVSIPPYSGIPYRQIYLAIIRNKKNWKKFNFSFHPNFDHSTTASILQTKLLV